MSIEKRVHRLSLLVARDYDVKASHPSHFAHLYLISSRNYQFARRTTAAKIHYIAADLLIIGLWALALPSNALFISLKRGGREVANVLHAMIFILSQK